MNNARTQLWEHAYLLMRTIMLIQMEAEMAMKNKKWPFIMASEAKEIYLRNSYCLPGLWKIFFF